MTVASFNIVRSEYTGEYIVNILVQYTMSQKKNVPLYFRL